jgi:hypothetical protein
MNELKINKCTEKEKESHNNLLKSFSLVFGSKDPYNIGLLLHDNGLFFGGMNKIRVESYFFNFFFNKNLLSDYYNLDIEKAISMDHLPGEEVLIFRFYPLDTDRQKLLKLPIEEKVMTFAFTFKDELIYTIRKPLKTLNNIREYERLN